MKPPSVRSKVLYGVIWLGPVSVVSIVLVWAVFSWNGSQEIVSTAGDRTKFKAGSEEEGGVPGFRDVARASGVVFRMSFLPNEQGETFKVNLYDHGCGVAVADYDGDGDDDVLFLNQLGPNALYRNKGDGTFDDVTDEAGPLAMNDRIKVGAAFGDYDNDDDQDLYITSTRGGNVLLENMGEGRFRDVTDEAGVGIVAHSQTPAFFDYDNDGDLDLYVTNSAKWTTNEFDAVAKYYRGSRHPMELVRGPGDYERNILYQNDGGRRFIDVTEEVGLAGLGWSSDVAVFDFDEDGDLDLLVAKMFGISQLYRNDGQGHFDDVTSHTLRRTSYGGTGCKAFDFNNDGRLDLFIADMHSDMWMGLNPSETYSDSVEPTKKYRYKSGPAAENDNRIVAAERDFMRQFKLSYDELLFGNSLFRNDGDGRFKEVSDSAGMETFWPWGVAVGDFDGDGYEDAFLPSGMGYPFIYSPNCLMRNNGDGTFSDVASKEGVEPPAEGLFLPERIHGQQAPRSSRSAAVADFDCDGRLELMVNNFNDRPYYFKNQFPSRHYVAFHLRGTKSNHDAIGALVKLFIGPQVMVRQVHANGGYLSQSSKTLHFGLGDHERIDRAEIRWPSGARQVIESPAVDRKHEIVEGQ